MKLIVLHGNDIEKLESRMAVFIKAAKTRDIVIERLDVRKDNIYDRLNASSIFDEEILVVIEYPKILKKVDLEWISDNFESLGVTIVIYSTSVLSKTYLSYLPGEKIVEEYSLPSLLFKFLESFYPGNSETCIKILYELKGATPVELIYTMLSRHLKDLYWVKADKESLSYPSWRINKLSRQSSMFSEIKLKIIINRVAESDIKSKTSNSTIDASLDLLILTQLE